MALGSREEPARAAFRVGRSNLEEEGKVELYPAGAAAGRVAGGDVEQQPGMKGHPGESEDAWVLSSRAHNLIN